MSDEPGEIHNRIASQKRASRSGAWVISSNRFTILEMKFWTGGWSWKPSVTTDYYHGWNDSGGPAIPVMHTKIYWLCFGWSRLSYLNYLTDPDNERNRNERN